MALKGKTRVSSLFLVVEKNFKAFSVRDFAGVLFSWSGKEFKDFQNVCSVKIEWVIYCFLCRSNFLLGNRQFAEGFGVVASIGVYPTMYP